MSSLCGDAGNLLLSSSKQQGLASTPQNLKLEGKAFPFLILYPVPELQK